MQLIPLALICLKRIPEKLVWTFWADFEFNAKMETVPFWFWCNQRNALIFRRAHERLWRCDMELLVPWCSSPPTWPSLTRHPTVYGQANVRQFYHVLPYRDGYHDFLLSWSHYSDTCPTNQEWSSQSWNQNWNLVMRGSTLKRQSD